jgi:Na+/proline symporter
LPVGLIGLLIAVIFSAAMSSTAGEVNALASTTVVDYYKRLLRPDASQSHYLFISRLFTLLWGLLAIAFALFAHLVENLIEAVNILGSLFYGTVLGIFIVAFFTKRVGGKQVFWAAVISQILVLGLHFLNQYEVIRLGYLWYNLVGCLCVYLLAQIFSLRNSQAKIA